MRFKNKFQKTIENLRKHKLVATEIRRNYLVPGPNYHTTKFFTENLLATKTLMNKLVHLGLSILE